MAQIVKLRRSSVSGQKPTNTTLQLGELALNTVDGKVFFAKSGSLGPTVEELVSTNTTNTGSVNISGSINLIGNQTISGSLNITGSLTASGINYPIVDGGEKSFIQTDGNGNLSLQYVDTLLEPIRNGESFPLVKGTPVYISGSIGANPLVYVAQAANPSKMPVIYIVNETIDVGETGVGILLGKIEGVDTTGYPVGTEIFIGPTGGWTSTRPTGSSIVQSLGIVTKEGSGGQGIVLNPGPANLPNLSSDNIWLGDINGIPQQVDKDTLGFTTTGSFESFTSSYSTDSSSFDSRINTITGSITNINSEIDSLQLYTGALDNFTSSFILNSQTSSMTVLTSSYALTASFALNAGGGTEGRTARLDQTTASTTWTFNHNLGEQFPAVTIYDFSDNVVIPTTINAQDDNTLIISFSSPQSGTATATVGGGLPFISGSFDGYVLSAVGGAPTWKGGIVSSSLQITNFGYATTGSNTFTNNQIINGTLSVRNSLIQQITTTGVTTNTIITSFPTSSYDGGFFDYVIKNGTNLRSGTVTSVWTSNNVEFNEVTTNDLGDTSGVNMLVTLSEGNANLNANVSSGTWTIKVLSRGL
jgi:hypothetical protein